jgi:glycosyltransferase involved in cell wall biosynthesis
LTTSVIIPVYNLEGYRLRNFKFVLQRCLESKADEIIVVEQLDTGKKGLALPEDDRINHIMVESELGYVHKTLICNIGVQNATGDYIIFNDADIYMKLDDVIDQIDPETDKVIKPFECFVKFDEDITNEFINKRRVKAKNCSVIHDLGAGAIVLHKQSFLDIRGYDERYMGWGFEDKEFADRVTKIFDVKILPFKGVHLYHDTHTPFDALDRNSALYRLSKKSMFVNIDQYVKDIRSLIPYIKRISSRKIKKLDKSNFLNKLTSVGQTPIKSAKIKMFEGKIEKSPIQKICHVTAPAWIPDKADLYKREELARESYITAKIVYEKERIGLQQLAITDSKHTYTNIQQKELRRSSNDIGDKKGLPYLKDLLDIAAETGADMLIYTNSDCCISPDFYTWVANSTAPVIEFHRKDVFGEINTLEDVYNNPFRLHATGVDALAIRTDFWAKYRSKINFDFFIGEPHWDTSLCGIFRRLGVSSVNTEHLYHPQHSRAWSTANLTVAGKHNTELYKEFLDCGLLQSEILSIPTIDTSIVMVHYGHDPLRLAAIRKNFEMLAHQDLDVQYVFVELIFDETAFPEFVDNPQIKHIQLPATDAHKNLWQKEVMMTIGAKEADGEYIIFIDSDVHSTRTDWFRRIRNKLKDDPRKMVQGFRMCCDSEDPQEHSFISVASTIVFNFQCDLPPNPGLVWGVSKSMLEINDYLNSYMIYGGGDSMFMHEYLQGNDDNQMPEFWINTFDKIEEINRPITQTAIIDCVDDDVIHCNHGKVGRRNYKTRHYMTGYFTKPIQELVVKDENGLLTWVDPNCPERRMCSRRYDMESIHLVRDICTQILNESKVGV